MKKEIGKLYSSNANIVVICTGEGINNRRFSGVVVKSDSPDFPLGYYSDSWIWQDIFKEHIGEVSINNINYKTPIEIGACQDYPIINVVKKLEEENKKLKSIINEDLNSKYENF
jgi:hypothetical protein